MNAWFQEVLAFALHQDFETCGTPRNNVVLLFDPFVLYLCGVQVTKALQHEKQHTRAIMGELLLIFTGILAAHFLHLIVCFCTNKIYDLFKREV
jgi:hypothetical protein